MYANERALEKAMEHFQRMAEEENTPRAYGYAAASLSGIAVLWLELYRNDYGLVIVEQRIEPLINEYRQRARHTER